MAFIYGKEGVLGFYTYLGEDVFLFSGLAPGPDMNMGRTHGRHSLSL